MSTPTRVAIVFGGVSSEHGVSCLTAASVLQAIDLDRYEVTCIGIAPSGRWTLVDLDVARSLHTVDGVLPTVPESGPEVVLVSTGRGPGLCVREGDRLDEPRPLDVAFALLHGPFGEDGTIQGLFEMHQLRYVGAGVAASANGMDKHLMKACFAAAGLPQGPYEVVTARQWATDRDAVTARLERLDLPWFVKPARAGSSIGITKVNHPEQVAAAIGTAQQHDPKVVIEQGIIGREIECAVLGSPDGASPRTSLVGEIRMVDGSGFYDFDAKYLPGEQVALDIPARIDDALQARVQEIAVQAFDAIGAEGLGRVDTFVLESGEVLVNEINTMPGFTQYSMYPQLWQKSGLGYGELIDELIAVALARPTGLR
ncbi:D-alanine--D-alanine ligase family protein [Aestuariimicrobium kwangyangense]|uniref:D-alanine--D-alanine ligase family protein n=1 Tax=Aestuariimicrobium kwangyangense TaxID=396389 RepID=UPI0003B61E86|nr:D-alanine--D-alanine ligase family protein [Aestuariimicrobium kwangyangense]